MSTASAAYFDAQARNYDQAWTNSGVGRAQRDAVWRAVDGLVKAGARVLDLGCGTGEDALHFIGMGARVEAIDVSPRMVEAARSRGVDARLLSIEEIARLQGTYDLVFSNFGALNCVPYLAGLRCALASLVNPGGTLAVCVLNRCCLWESLYYSARGSLKKASRRWRGSAETSSGLRVFYPTASGVVDAIAPEFRLVEDRGIGVAVPPSYVQLRAGVLRRLESLDSRIAGWKVARALGDHRLLIFERLA